MTTSQTRRSDRLMLTIPLKVQGVDADGQEFEIPARTVILNRHGAHVKIPRKLRAGQTVRLVNLVTSSKAEFRIVRPVSTPSENGGDYGVECTEPDGDIWQIEFAPLENGEAADARALLECQICRKVYLAHLTLGELETLRTYGVVGKSCAACRTETPLRYADFGTVKLDTVDEGWKTLFSGFSRQRRHRRVCLQLPLGIRDGKGGVEVSKTENVSKGGFCFTSEKEYHAGQGVTVVFRGGTFSRNVEVPAQIVWQQRFEKNNRKIYGIQCERLIAPRETARF